MALVASLTLTAFVPKGEAAGQHTVASGESLWKIANKYGVSVNDLSAVNNQRSTLIYPGQKLVIPSSGLSETDKDLMARLVHAEAKGESYAGKVAVATVILNRVDSSKFPNTVKGVIYENVQGHYAFTPVQNGEINKPADAEAKRAVNEALAFRGQGNGSLYFYNPKTATSDWVFTRQTTITIGNHRFAK
ncbi:cell wall hydrolase [Bacillus sp. B15-48]|uniref:cell wall hydrolase n=1 Tax=Bacillus sp. B15-48 TaxID=1548601 RepID=UPI001EF353BF|nr:cell wall hydrolase [Bacillus sp. B15-48]